MSPAARSRQAGAAYLLLLVLMAAFTGLFAVALDHLVPAAAAHRAAAEGRVADLRLRAAADYARNGAFAANLTTLATRSNSPTTGTWRLDPYGSAADLRWQVTGRPRVLRVDSRGRDGRLGTADDVTFQLSEQSLGRARSRDHLRILRARIVAWQATGGSAAMSPAEVAALRAASRSYARARRDYAAADSGGRAALTAQMASDLAVIRALRTTYGIAFPTRVTGASGLMRAVGLADATAIDGWGRVLLWNEAIGVVSRGGDNRGGTDDDF